MMNLVEKICRISSRVWLGYTWMVELPTLTVQKSVEALRKLQCLQEDLPPRAHPAPRARSPILKQETIREPATIKDHFAEKFFLILLRQTFGQTNEEQRRHLLTAYYDETTPKTDDQPAAKKPKVNEAADTPKKQQIAAAETDK